MKMKKLESIFTFAQLNFLWKSKQIPLKLKIIIFNTEVKYGC